MRHFLIPFVFLLSALGVSAQAWADEYRETVDMFREAKAPQPYFKSAYGYAVFPTIGKGGFIVGGAYGEGRVYKHHKYMGTTSMAQASVAFSWAVKLTAKSSSLKTNVPMTNSPAGTLNSARKPQWWRSLPVPPPKRAPKAPALLSAAGKTMHALPPTIIAAWRPSLSPKAG